MKRLISVTVCMMFAFSAYSQSQSPTYDELYMAMKSDQVLQNIFFDLQKQVAQSIDYQNRCNQLTVSIKAQQDAELQKLADSLGYKNDDKYNNPERFGAYNHLAVLIYDRYRPLMAAATEDVSKQYTALLQQAFIEAAKKYYDNANVIKGSN